MSGKCFRFSNRRCSGWSRKGRARTSGSSALAPKRISRKRSRPWCLCPQKSISSRLCPPTLWRARRITHRVVLRKSQSTTLIVSWTGKSTMMAFAICRRIRSWGRSPSPMWLRMRETPRLSIYILFCRDSRSHSVILDLRRNNQK